MPGKTHDAEQGVEELVTLGHSFGELGMALQAAAGVAVHLGRAERARDLADQVLDRHRATGAVSSEGVVLKALAMAQLGALDEALAAIESIDVADFPFGRAARALVRSVTNDDDGAREDADAVDAMLRPSYFDQAVAQLSRVLVTPEGSPERDGALVIFTNLVTAVGDVPMLAVADALNGGHPDDRSGWLTLVGRAALPTG